jgi:hypothetical protein
MLREALSGVKATPDKRQSAKEQEQRASGNAAFRLPPQTNSFCYEVILVVNPMKADKCQMINAKCVGFC